MVHTEGMNKLATEILDIIKRSDGLTGKEIFEKVRELPDRKTVYRTSIETVVQYELKKGHLTRTKEDRQVNTLSPWSGRLEIVTKQVWVYRFAGGKNVETK